MKKDIYYIQDRAKAFATKAHEGVIDDSGAPYIRHPQQVVSILRQVTTDEEIFAAGWLHDVIEDTKYTYEDILREFGKRVADLVNEVTQEGQKDAVGYYFPRLQTREGILIKFADRLSNLSRMDSWDDKRRAQYIKKSKFWKSEV